MIPNDLLALAEVTYSPQEFLNEMSGLSEETQKKMLYNFRDMQSIEGIYLVTRELRLAPASGKDIVNYGSKLPRIKAAVHADISSLEYLGGVRMEEEKKVKKLSIGSTDFAMIKRKEGERIKPHAHVIDGKNILSNGEVLEFE